VRTLRSPKYRQGFTLAELIVVIAVIGAMAAVAIPIYSGVHETSRREIARAQMEAFNRGIKNFTQSCWALPVVGTAPTKPDPASGNDELTVLKCLQITDSTTPPAGFPFYNPRFYPGLSSDPNKFRAQWTGTVFKLLGPGAGAGNSPGINLEDGSIGTAYAGAFSPPPPDPEPATVVAP
jgi:prepilin-type N-terminal cleavage/methylation domain-containing protein